MEKPMDNTHFTRFLPNIKMISEELTGSGQDNELYSVNPEQNYLGVRLYHPAISLKKRIIYIVDDEYKRSFPANEYSYISTNDLEGQANHIICPHMNPGQIMEQLLNIFASYQEKENQLNQLVFANASLDEMCELGRRLLGNPICFHDDWFLIIAMSEDFGEIVRPERRTISLKGFIPQKIIDIFKYDTEYLDSYSNKKAELWTSAQLTEFERFMYVNLWEDDVHKGRMLILEKFQKFRSSDYLLAECLAQRAALIMHKRKNSRTGHFHGFDDVMYKLLKNKHIDTSDLNLLMDMTSWKKTDQFLCVRMQYQMENAAPVLVHVLNRDLLKLFPNSYIILIEHQIFVILNLTKEPISIPMVRHRLADPCRDYCLYAGISSPVKGIHELGQAYLQTDIALKQAFNPADDRWVVPFSTCALEHMLRSIQSDLFPRNLVAPELLLLLEYDRQKGTQYFDTLRTYLLMERDIPKTAESMIIHRTTLIYRLKKIQSMTNVNLEDSEQRLYLLLSLRLLKQEQIDSF